MFLSKKKETQSCISEAPWLSIGEVKSSRAFVGCTRVNYLYIFQPLSTIHVGFKELDFPAREIDEREIWRLGSNKSVDALCMLVSASDSGKGPFGRAPAP